MSVINDNKIMEEAIERFSREFPAKFLAGQRRYKDSMLDKDCLAEALPEVYDLVSYLVAESIKKRRTLELMHSLRYFFDMNAEKPEMATFYEIINLLSPKPLATKMPVVVVVDPNGQEQMQL